ncbi:MAG: glycoside hydrolase family 38 C-terminal domain-containing protein, partial [bacterium]|nr:glycoside hydrolase family 38 C-terminal domain-containing protein [bacterium]
DIQLDFEPDTFGHNLNVPAILSRTGAKYYYHCRALDGPKLYRWQSPDGSRLLCYHEKDDWYNYDVLPEGIVRSVLNEVEKTGSRSILRVYGVGDHGGGPAIRDIETIKEMSSWPVFPTIKFSTYKEYFDAIERSGLELPVLEGEHNFIFTGCYTSQSETKAANRYGEKLLSVAESFSALAGKLTEGFDYPKSELCRAWERVLFNQFHDILPGSGKRQTRHYALGQHQEVKAATGAALKKALTAINKAIDTQAVLGAAGVQSRVRCDRALGAGAGFWQDCKGMSAPAVDDSSYRIFTVFNPSSFWRSEVVEAVLWDMGDSEDNLVVKDCRGKEVVHQVTEGIQSYWGHTFRRILFEADSIPPLGYKTFVVCKQHSQPNIKAQPVQLETPAQAVLENDKLRIELDTVSGAIKSLVSKESGDQFVPGDGLTALFRIIDEAAALPGRDGMPVQGMTAWQIGAYSNIETIKGIKFIKASQPPDFYSTIERSSFRSLRGPLRNGYVWSVGMRGSELTTAIYLDKGSNRINIDCKCDWLEVSRKGEPVPQLNIVFPLSLENSARHFEIPFGSTRRDIEDIDVPALRWGDISGVVKGTDRQAGLTVMTDSKYGYRTGDDYISVSLIRSSNDPDPYPELGEHCFSLAVIPHDGLCNAADAFRQAVAFDQPLIVSQAVPAQGIMPPECSFVEIKNNNLVLSSLKKQEDGEGTVIRLYEVAGMDTEAEIRLRSELFGKKVLVTEIDLLECKTGVPTVFSSDAVKCRIPAYGLFTLLVEVI